MAPLHLMLLLLAAIQCSSGNSITHGTELVFTFIVNRHGDRAPGEKTLKYVGDSVDMDLAKKKIQKYGYEQLTEKGKKRAYELGKFLRSRYDGLLSQTYDPSEIYVRASNNTRTKETLRFQMAGLYPAQSVVCNNTVIHQPVPNSVINNIFKDLNFYQGCSSYKKYLDNTFKKSYPSISAQYPTLLEKLTTITGTNVTSRPGLEYDLYDTYHSLQNVGYKLKPEIKALLPETEKVAGDLLEIFLGQNEYLPVEAGVLLNDFFTTATKIYNKTCTEKMRVYSAHDFNVFAMQMVSEAIPSQGVPYYCSLLALELRRIIKTGELVVLPVYLPKPGKPVVYLRVRGCGGYLCDYHTFQGITKGSSITLQQYDTRCQSNGSSSQ